MENAQLFQERIAGSELLIIEESGHVPLFEFPKLSAQAFDAFTVKYE